MDGITYYIPPPAKRKAVSMQAVEEAVGHIAGSFPVERIYLFRSQSRQKTRPDSGVGLLVVMETPPDEARQADELLQAAADHFGLDLLVYTPQALAQRLESGDPFVKAVIKRGKVIYASPRR